MYFFLLLSLDKNNNGIQISAAGASDDVFYSQLTVTHISYAAAPWPRLCMLLIIHAELAYQN